MKIVADKNIPYLKGVAEKYGDVVYLSGNEFTKDSIKDADTLIVRTVTYFGKEILEGSNVKLICSATIGYDHIDTQYCDAKGIIWKNAPGCNSGSVKQYIVSVLLTLAHQKGFDLKDKTIGIIGVGNVGKKVAAACQSLGMKVLLNDPPREEAEASKQFVSLETIKKEADIITFHTPLIKEGKYKTQHLADSNFFSTLNKKPIIINSARGAIIDTPSIKKAISNKLISGTVIDCWENEPNIDPEFLNAVEIATPHIAGYSADGKANATRMSLESIARFWNMTEKPIEEVVAPEIENNVINGNGNIADVILRTYNPMEDHNSFVGDPSRFSALRGNYPVRREYNAYTITNAEKKESNILKDLGFNVV